MAQETSVAGQILYVEDEVGELPVDLLAIEHEFHMPVVLATSVAQARERLECGHFRLFVLDIEIKGERATGIQLAETIRRLPQYVDTPILFTSMYTHYSHWLLAKIRHCAFLPKPFDKAALISQIGVALEIPRYVADYYAVSPLLLENVRGTYIEVDPLAVSYIELIHRDLHIQYISGKAVTIKGRSGLFKSVLSQIDERHITCLRQIYRSIIININQLQSIEVEKNIGTVRLFHDEQVKPLGIRYRDNIREFL